MAREGRKVGIISTEDSLKQIRKWMRNVPADSAVWDNVYFEFVEDVSSPELRDLIGQFSENVEVLFIDYLRADVLRSYSGDLFATMSQLYKVMRSALETFDVAIIQTIQANSTLYKSDVRELLAKSESVLYASVDGGPQTAKRSLFVGILLNNKGNRGIYVLKAKGEHHKMEGLVWQYGSVSENFAISYDSGPLKVEQFYGMTSENSNGKGPQRAL